MIQLVKIQMSSHRNSYKCNNTLVVVVGRGFESTMKIYGTTSMF